MIKKIIEWLGAQSKLLAGVDKSVIEEYFISVRPAADFIVLISYFGRNDPRHGNQSGKAGILQIKGSRIAVSVLRANKQTEFDNILSYCRANISPRTGKITIRDENNRIEIYRVMSTEYYGYNQEIGKLDLPTLLHSRQNGKKLFELLKERGVHPMHDRTA